MVNTQVFSSICVNIRSFLHIRKNRKETVCSVHDSIQITCFCCQFGIQQKWKCKCIEGFWALIISGGCKINYSTSVNLTQPQGCTRTHTHNTHLQFGHCFTKSTCHHSRTSPLQAFDMSLVYLLKHTGWFILILNGPGFHYHSICSIQIKAKKNENDARLSP